MDNRQVASMLLSGAITSRDLGPGRMTKKKKKKSNKKSKRKKPKKS